MSRTSLDDLLSRQRAVILDGGLGTELEHAGLDLDDPLWSARVLMEAPDAIRRVHTEFLEAGADVIASASYQATFEGFASRGLTRAQAVALMERSVRLACDARDAFWRGCRDPSRHRPLVAASVGPYGALLADGSEYRGGYGRSVDELAAFHRPRLATLIRAGAELVACETVPCPEEAEALRLVLADFPDVRAWIAFSCRDGHHVAQGETFRDCVARVPPSDQLVAVGVNCTAPEHVTSLLRDAAHATSAVLVAYPNSSEVWDAESHRWRPGAGQVSDLAALVRAWHQAGARLIGGCCRTRPADIRRIRATLLREPSREERP